MHRHHRIERQQIVEQAEDGFLHFPGISGAADQDQFLGQVDRNHGFAARAVTRGIGLEAGQVDNRIFRNECRKFIGIWPHQHRADEKIVPRQFIDDPDIDAMFRLRAAEQILDEQGFLLGQGRKKVGLQRCKMIRRHRDIGFAPPHAVFGFAIPHDELVIGGAPGVLARFHDQGTVLRQMAFASGNGRFNQRGRTEIPVLLGRIGKTLII